MQKEIILDDLQNINQNINTNINGNTYAILPNNNQNINTDLPNNNQNINTDLPNNNQNLNTDLQNINQNKDRYIESNKYSIQREIIAALLTVVFPLIFVVTFTVMFIIFPRNEMRKKPFYDICLVALVSTLTIMILIYAYIKFLEYFVNKFIPLQYQPFIYRSEVEIQKVIIPNDISFDLFVIVEEYQNNMSRELGYSVTWIVRTLYISMFIAFHQIDIITIVFWILNEGIIAMGKRYQAFGRPCMFRLRRKIFCASQEKEYRDAFQKHQQQILA